MEYVVTYIERGFGGNVATVEGPLSLIERDGKVVEVVVETVDGGATFIPANAVIAWEALA